MTLPTNDRDKELKMLDKKEVLKLEAELKVIREKLRIHYIEELLQYCGVSPGEKVRFYKNTYLLLDMDGLIRYNNVGGYITLYGRRIKKNGEPSMVVHALFRHGVGKFEE